MPTKECETPKVFFSVDGEMREFTEIKEITHTSEIDDEEMIDVSDVPCEGTFTIDLKYDRFDTWCILSGFGLKSNNWRKTHHIPLRRKKRVRK